jgi:glycosyltransferase involved in cell wall biosynthesis
MTAVLDAPSRRHGSARAPAVVLDARVVRGSGGGPDKTILNSPRFLEHAGYRNLCLYLRAPGDAGFERLRLQAQIRRTPLIEIDDRGPLDLGIVPKLLNVCRRERVQIWHGHDYKTNALGLLLQRMRPRMRLITTVHGWVHHTSRTPLYYWIDRLSLRGYEKVICVSPDLYESCLRGGVPADRCELIENGIDLDDYARKRSVSEAKRRLGLDPNRLLVGAAGRLSGEKGFDRLIRCVDRLLNDGRDVDLVVVGEGDERASLESLIAQLGRQGRARLLGFRSDLPEWFQAMDVFVLSSLREGLPNVVLEAMALETPVVATRIAGVPRLVRDGENGLLVAPDSVEELTAALSRLLGDPALRERLGKAGRRTVEADYSFAVRMDKMRVVYDRLLGRD